jgi:hypothetical protein
MIDFEHKLKPNFNCYTASGIKSFSVPGLHANDEKGFMGDSLQISV